MSDAHPDPGIRTLFDLFIRFVDEGESYYRHRVDHTLVRGSQCLQSNILRYSDNRPSAILSIVLGYGSNGGSHLVGVWELLAQ